MKPAMIRTMESQGRIIIPHEIRRTMNLSGGDTIEIRTVENGVLLSKYKSASAGDRSMKKYLNILYSVTRCGAAICTEDQVIVSNMLRNIFIANHFTLRLVYLSRAAWTVWKEHITPIYGIQTQQSCLSTT